MNATYHVRRCTVAHLLQDQGIALEELVERTALDERVAHAIARQCYTPSPDQRDRVARVFNVPRHRIIWGHRMAVMENCHERL